MQPGLFWLLTALKLQSSPGGGFIDATEGKQFYSVREKDMPALLKLGDGLGFMGNDTFIEIEKSTREGLVYQPVATTASRFVLAAVKGKDLLPSPTPLRIATSYPEVARMSLLTAGVNCGSVLKMGGSVEAAPYIDPTIDAIFDIVETGDTLRENGLEIVFDNLAPVKVGAVWKRN
ncbi:MAG TPA: hypothetical protein VK978_04375 [Candidatus Saccharimonadales bacterium]|nr:hypothetical protein [Candidatus Saccharimonadales bacterium]